MLAALAPPSSAIRARQSLAPPDPTIVKVKLGHYPTAVVRLGFVALTKHLRIVLERYFYRERPNCATSWLRVRSAGGLDWCGLETSPQREMQICALGELFALDAKQCQPHGIQTQLLLLD